MPATTTVTPVTFVIRYTPKFSLSSLLSLCHPFSSQFTQQSVGTPNLQRTSEDAPFICRHSESSTSESAQFVFRYSESSTYIRADMKPCSSAKRVDGVHWAPHARARSQTVDCIKSLAPSMFGVAIRVHHVFLCEFTHKSHNFCIRS